VEKVTAKEIDLTPITGSGEFENVLEHGVPFTFRFLSTLQSSSNVFIGWFFGR